MVQTAARVMSESGCGEAFQLVQVPRLHSQLPRLVATGLHASQQRTSATLQRSMGGVDAVSEEFCNSSLLTVAVVSWRVQVHEQKLSS